MKAYEVPSFVVGTLLAAADLSAKQFYAVKIDSSGNVALAGNGDAGCGILQNTPDASGKSASFMKHGISKAVLGGTVTAGNDLQSDSNGKLVARTGSGVVVGTALTSGVSGDYIPVLLGSHNVDLNESVSFYSVFSIPVNLASITTNMDVAKNFTLPFGGTIEKVFFQATQPVTTGSKATDLSVTIDGTPLTGGTVGLTSANLAQLGDTVNSSAITAANTFTSSSNLKVVSTNTTAFAEGAGVLQIVMKQTATV